MWLKTPFLYHKEKVQKEKKNTSFWREPHQRNKTVKVNLSLQSYCCISLFCSFSKNSPPSPGEKTHFLLKNKFYHIFNMDSVENGRENSAFFVII